MDRGGKKGLGVSDNSRMTELIKWTEKYNSTFYLTCRDPHLGALLLEHEKLLVLLQQRGGVRSWRQRVHLSA